MKKGKFKFFGITGITAILLISAVITCATMVYAEDAQPEEAVEEVSTDESIPAEDEITIVTDSTDTSAEQASPSETDIEYPDIEYIENDLASPSDSETASPSETEYEEVDIEYKDSETIILPVLERDGYVFVEWNTKEDGSGESYKAGEEYKVETDGNLYAIWKKADDTQDENQVKEIEPEENEM